MGTRASSSSPVRLATRSAHTQGGYALWAHGPPPAPQSGSSHALYTRREDTHCEHTGLLQLPSQARHTLCTHAGRIRTVGTRASSSSPVRLATRSAHTHREDTHCGHTGLLQLPSQARHTLCTHAGRIRTVSTRASSSPVRLATRSVHTQGGYALWAHGPPPAPQSGSPRALYTRREDTHCGHTGLLQLPSQARHTLCTHAGRIRTVGTRASSSSPVRLATRSAHTQGGYALWAHGPPPAPQSGSPHALYTHREDTHCGHTGLLQLPSQARHTLCTHAGRIRTVGTRASSSSPVRLATRSVHTGRIRTVGTRASSSSPVRLATRSVHTQGGYALWAHGPPPAPQSGSPHALYTAGRIRTVSTRASSSSPVRLATRSAHTQGGYAL